MSIVRGKQGKKKFIMGTFVVVGVAVISLIILIGSGGDEGGLNASFTMSKSSPKIDSVVLFEDTSSGDPISWKWDFDGDGTVDSTEQNPSYQYSEAGYYEVKLTVEYPGNISKTCTKGILVIDVEYPPGENDYLVFTDRGLPVEENFWGDAWVWPNLPSEDVEGKYLLADAPEGDEVWMINSGNHSFAGWGVFLGVWVSHDLKEKHATDLSKYEKLTFWVKTPCDLEVRVEDNSNESNPCLVSDYGWDPSFSSFWQKIEIPASAFINVDFTKIHCPFKITGEGENITYYVDYVRWV